jgi:hypothetical protein
LALEDCLLLSLDERLAGMTDSQIAQGSLAWEERQANRFGLRDVNTFGSFTAGEKEHVSYANGGVQDRKHQRAQFDTR